MLWNETKVANFLETLEDYKVGPQKTTSNFGVNSKQPPKSRVPK